MFSFQPAAFVGDERRWHENYRQATLDAVWGAASCHGRSPIGPTTLRRTSAQAAVPVVVQMRLEAIDDKPVVINVRQSRHRYCANRPSTGHDNRK